jgi:hypothetical protein
MIGRLLLIVAAGPAAVALVSSLPAPASTNVTRLVGTTGPGFMITLKKGGKDVDYLRRGRYTITVRDRSSKHGFRLTSRRQVPGGWTVGLDVRITSVRFVGRKTVTVTLKPGVHDYTCPAHGKPGGYDPPIGYDMAGSFRVE